MADDVPVGAEVGNVEVGNVDAGAPDGSAAGLPTSDPVGADEHEPAIEGAAVAVAAEA